MIIQIHPGESGTLRVRRFLGRHDGHCLLQPSLTGFPKNGIALSGIILGTLFLAIAGRASLPGLGQTPWFSVPAPFFPGLPGSPSITLSFLVAYMAVIVNGVGSIYSVGEVVGKRETGTRVTRGSV